MSESHASEPWEIAVDGLTIKAVYGNPRMEPDELMPATVRPGRHARANARRIVACVNACQGISTEALQGGIVARSIEELNRLKSGG
jgi:hypothetical protein